MNYGGLYDPENPEPFIKMVEKSKLKHESWIERKTIQLKSMLNKHNTKYHEENDQIDVECANVQSPL